MRLSPQLRYGPARGWKCDCQGFVYVLRAAEVATNDCGERVWWNWNMDSKKNLYSWWKKNGNVLMRPRGDCTYLLIIRSTGTVGRTSRAGATADQKNWATKRTPRHRFSNTRVLRSSMFVSESARLVQNTGSTDCESFCQLFNLTTLDTTTARNEADPRLKWKITKKGLITVLRLEMSLDFRPTVVPEPSQNYPSWAKVWGTTARKS